MRLNQDELLGLCDGKKHIYIYGAGKNASKTFYFLKKNNIEIKGFLVSSLSNNPQTLFGYTVAGVDTFSDDSEYLILVPVLKGCEAYREIFDILIGRHIHNVYFIPTHMLNFIEKDYFVSKKRSIFCTDQYYLKENVPVEIKHEIFAMRNAKGDECHWRFFQALLENQNVRCISDIFPNQSAIEEFEEQYGEYNVIPLDGIMCDEDSKETYSVYMACSHVDKVCVHDSIPSWVIPIQVGAGLTDTNICEVKDNCGENISDRNRNYSECTAFFWMWKNAPKTNYIGLCHYRRHFDLEENEIGQIAASGIDVLVTTPSFLNETIGNFFSKFTPKTDLIVLLKTIKKVSPEYISTAEKFLDSRFFPPCNLFVMKYELFQEYAQFVFSITFEIERFYDELGFCREDRYMGYIIECLLGIFLMKNKERLKIAYTDMRFYS